MSQRSDAPAQAVSRRTLVRSAAWAVPVVAATVSVPASVASGILHSEILFLGLSGCVPGSAAFPSPAAKAHAWDHDGPVPLTEATFVIWSADGGTVIIDGETYPGSTAPLLRAAASGEVYLDDITAGAPGTINFAAIMKTLDGRTTGVDMAAVVEIC